ncbi:MAG: SRPBCC family protein [Bacillota bacterium]
MARIQQSIEINVPVHAAYSKLVQFDEYPRFMQGVETVRQTDDTHLHWTAKMAERDMEWDAEITERREDRCIAWRNLSGPQNIGKVELQELGRDKASITLTMECEPGQMPGQMPGAQGGNAEGTMAQRVWEDLARFKKLVETRDAESGDWRPSDSGMQQATAHPVHTTQSEASLSRASGLDDGQGRFGISEEQNFDQQSDQARRVGRMPSDIPGADPAESMAQAMHQAEPDGRQREQMTEALDRSVPPSESEPGAGSSGNSPGNKRA